MKKFKPLKMTESVEKTENVEKTERGEKNKKPKKNKNIVEYSDKLTLFEVINKATSILLCFALLAVAIISFFLPFIMSASDSFSGFDLIFSWDANAFNESIGSIPLMLISYYIDLVFHFLFVAVLAFCVFFAFMAALVRGPKLHKSTSSIMYVILTFLLIQTLLAINYISVSFEMQNAEPLATSMTVTFLIGAALTMLKFITDIIFGKKNMPDELKDSSSAVYAAFTQSILALLGLVCPMYILPGFARVFGFDVVFQTSNDFMSYLPMAKIYSWFLLALTMLTALSFVANTVAYLINKKLFVRIKKFGNLFSLFTIITFAFMGINFQFNYLEAEGFSRIITLALNTYSYLPLAGLLLFKIGYAFSRISTKNVIVQYKVFATPEEDLTPKAKEAKKKAEEEKALEEEEKLKAEEEAKAAEAKKNEMTDPIPAFSELDKKADFFGEEHRKRTEYIFEEATLPELVAHVIEYAKYSREHLSYGPVEVKTFIAGLAASRLSILQGMSGTGKTSLPKIFMESIDGFCDIVAIESSWRDKNELLGYYNEFNKKYTPKTFTQYLYKASLNKEIPNFIVLDEMNLSRIEYYFSDFLSLMEARENLRNIKLFDVQLFPNIDERTQYTALRDGHTIDIPPNVWFIGTANRDESTFEISDKVYDRAQTMNFDKRAAKVIIEEEKVIPKKFVPYSVLRKLFDESKSIAFNAEQYAPILAAEKLLIPYKISFGNRVLKQIEEFVNAYVACSQISSPEDTALFTNEAVDCILFSKVIRKLELKQIIDIDTLIDDFKALNLPKCTDFIISLRETV